MPEVFLGSISPYFLSFFCSFVPRLFYLYLSIAHFLFFSLVIFASATLFFFFVHPFVTHLVFCFLIVLHPFVTQLVFCFLIVLLGLLQRSKIEKFKVKTKFVPLCFSLFQTFRFVVLPKIHICWPNPRTMCLENRMHDATLM